MGIQHEKRKKKKKGKKKGKRKKKKKETNQAMLIGLLHYCTLLSKEFLLFSTMPIFIETVMPIRTTIAIRLMVSLAIHALEDMRTWLTNIGSHVICFLVFHTAPRFLSVVFGIMSSIALSAPRDVSVIAQGCGQNLGLGLVDRNRTVVIISLQQMESM